MYWLDPASGRRRRGQSKDKLVHAGSELGEGVRKTAVDLAHRSRGLVADVSSTLHSAAPVSDDILMERVRSNLGRVCSHPGAIEVSASEGCVTLGGPVLATEGRRVVTSVRGVAGVKDVVDQMTHHKRAGTIPALQGGARRPAPRSELMRENWSPAIRFLMGGAGLGLVALASRRPTDPAGLGLGLAGAAIAARSVTNLPIKRLLGIGAGRRAVDIQKTLHVAAPIDVVFAFWRALENFPKFMPHVKDVRRIGDGAYHWCVAGPAGIPIEWNAEISALEDNRLLAWRSTEGAVVKSAGIVRFDEDNGGTRIHIRMTYNPPAGAVGHAFAKIFRSDPKKEMDDDLLRFKSIIETGKATGRGHQVTREELGVATASDGAVHAPFMREAGR
jgi:uncharacterized membrane protein